MYYLGMIGMNAVALKEWLNPAMAMWVPNILGTAISSALVFRAVRR